jgi:NhaP-type Na+/H+ or K+/H+ antiporter
VSRAAVAVSEAVRADPVLGSEVGQMIAELYIPALLTVGALMLLMAWLPMLLRRLPLSLPILCVGFGWLLFTQTPFQKFSPHPMQTPLLVEKATELIVIVSLMGAGLKIDRAMRWSSWAITVRLLAISMPLTIVAIMLGGFWMLGLSLASALLLGAVLAPTDPVLASDVQIKGPHSAQDDEVRFALTSEAGINDALAFPFVHLAIAASVGGFGLATWGTWALDAVALRLSVGLAMGCLTGLALGWLTYRVPSRARLSRSGDGFVAIGATLVVYALTELLYGYGFLAVFVAGLMLRRAARNHEFNTRLHDFADEAERLLMLLLLVLFGGMIAGGALFSRIGWTELIFALAVLLVIRPLAGFIGLLGVRRGRLELLIIAVFGIRGLGSVYYLAYGINHGAFSGLELLWDVVALIVLLSILLHGISVTPLMRRLDAQTRRADR